MEKFERNTTGFTADVELYDENSIIKIYRDYVPQKDIEREILCTQSVQNCGLMVPEYRGYVSEYNGKRAIIQEYISGESMMKLLLAGQAQPEDLAAKFAQIHYDMHQCEADGLEDSKVRYTLREMKKNASARRLPPWHYLPRRSECCRRNHQQKTTLNCCPTPAQ